MQNAKTKRFEFKNLLHSDVEHCIVFTMKTMDLWYRKFSDLVYLHGTHNLVRKEISINRTIDLFQIIAFYIRERFLYLMNE